MNPKNIQEYLANKVINEINVEKDLRIEYLEKILRTEHICFNDTCGCCNEFVVTNPCGKPLRTHSHCRECNKLICIDCNTNLCRICYQIIQRTAFVNSF